MSPSPSSLFFLVLFLLTLFGLGPVNAELQVTKKGVPSTRYSANFLGTDYPSLKFCGDIVKVETGASCTISPSFPGNFSSNQLLFLSWPDAKISECKSYEQLLAQLLLRIEAYEKEEGVAMPRGSLIIVGSDIEAQIGTKNERYGNISSFADFPFYLISVSAMVDIQIKTQLLDPHVCATLEIGVYTKHFSSPSYYAQQWLFSIWNGILTVISFWQLVVSIKSRLFHKLAAFVGIFGYTLFRFLRCSIDYQGKKGILHSFSPLENFLWFFGYIFLYLGYSFLLHAWVIVMRADVKNSFSKRVAKITTLLITVAFFLFAVLMLVGFLATVLKTFPFILVTVFFVLDLPPLLAVIFLFLTLGIRILFVLNSTITKNHLVLTQVTILMICVVLTFLGYVSFIVARSSNLLTNEEFSFSFALALTMLMEVFGLLGCTAVCLSYSLKAFSGKFNSFSWSTKRPSTFDDEGEKMKEKEREREREKEKEREREREKEKKEKKEEKEKELLKVSTTGSGSFGKGGVDAVIIELSSPEES